MKEISRYQMSRLMSIPEAKQVIEAKLVELRLAFKDKLEQGPEPEQYLENPKAPNIIRFPAPHKKNPADDSNTAAINNGAGHIDGTGHSDGSGGAAFIKIVDASGYRCTTEEEQVKIFMNYFRSHGHLRRAVLDEFFLRILPYSNIMVK